jgi:hypothetical protein
MTTEILTEIMALKSASINELQLKYRELFHDQIADSGNNRVWLWRKIAYKLQELNAGSLSATAKQKISDLIDKYDPINNKLLRPQVVSAGQNVVAIPLLRDKRLPIPGTMIQKRYKGQDILVKVLEKGFEYNHKYYKTLTSLTYEITGSHWNGYSFFNI